MLAAKQISGGRYSGRHLFIWRPPYNYMAAATLDVELSVTIFVAFDSLFTEMYANTVFKPANCISDVNFY